MKSGKKWKSARKSIFLLGDSFPWGLHYPSVNAAIELILRKKISIYYLYYNEILIIQVMYNFPLKVGLSFYALEEVIFEWRYLICIEI